MMEAVRLRVLFKDEDLLTSSLSGFSRSWIVSDLSSYIISVFHLRDACPNGIILSGPCRSSRRKKAKRRWSREKAQNEEQQQELFERSIDQEPSQNDDVYMHDDTVPVVVKPGHIRFEPVGKVAADQAGEQKQNHFPKEILHWNGITNKKKGQKWGKEETPSWKRNNTNNCSDEPLQLPVSETEQPTITAPVVGSINFDELRP